MKEIIIYQTDNRDYSFMPWEYAEEKFNMNDYKEVLYYTYTGDKFGRDLLEEIFNDGNNGKLHNQFPDNRFRSLSVSDIIEVDGMKYYIDRFGFHELEEV